MHALSVRQPFAEQIARGTKRFEYRTWAPRKLIGEDLLIVSSRVAESGGENFPLGVAVCVVRVVDIEDDMARYAWKLANPRRVKNVEVKGCAALFRVDDALIIPDGSLVRLSRAGSSIDPRARTNRKPRKRRTKLPYTFALGDSPIDAEERYPEAARDRARSLANQHGKAVTILRDGFAVAIVEAP